MDWFKEIYDKIIFCFVDGDRWKWITNGLLVTIIITICAAVMGVILGIIVASIRSSYDKNEESLARKGGFGYRIFKFFNGICKIYITIFRGTPIVVQLLLAYFVFLKSVSAGWVVAVITFGANSGAYVAEIIRGGIMSVDDGQFEAGRSLGFNYIQTMRYIVIPQAFKNCLPSLCNEVITLLKETSIAGYVGIQDLTKGGDLIRGRTFEAFIPLIVVAAVYLVMVMLLTKVLGIIERRLRQSER